MPRKDFILFLDLETTGNADEDEIVEVGLSLLAADGSCPEVEGLSIVVRPSEVALARLAANPIVTEMHTKSGLLPEIEDGVSVAVAEALAIEWLDGLVKGDLSSHVPLGGSGVLHFDRKYIKRQMPKLDARLSYWAYDVGVVRRMFQLIDIKAAKPVSGKTHRALDDARCHAEEFRIYLSLFGRRLGSLDMADA